MKKILLGKSLMVSAMNTKELVRAMQAYETPVMFMELHENLLNFEAFLQASSP